MSNIFQYGADQQRWSEAARRPGLFLARVIAQHRGLYMVATEAGECSAEVSGKFRYEAASAEQFPAVGDYVMVDRLTDTAGSATIQQVLARHSTFLRTAVENEQETQVIAVNIDTVFLCMSLNQNYSLNRMERYLSAAWSSGAVPVVLLMKSDLCPNLPQTLASVEEIAPGTKVIATSVFEPDSWECLNPYLQKGKTVSFIGSSGVGKSTMINLLAGGEEQKTTEIRSDGKGRHTTTSREMMILPGGGIVIDTPGMREFGVQSVDLARTFTDIDALASQCRFRDCTHEGEPGCAVCRAMEEGRLDARRVESYRKLKREASYDGLSSKQLEKEKLARMANQTGGMKNIRKYVRENDKRRGE